MTELDGGAGATNDAPGAAEGVAGTGALDVGGSVGVVRTHAAPPPAARTRATTPTAARAQRDGTRCAGNLVRRGKTKLRLEIAGTTTRALSLWQGVAGGRASFLDE